MQNLFAKVGFPFSYQIIIFLTALVVRWVSVFFNPSLSGADSKLYYEIARNIIAGNGFATNQGATAFVSPLFPLFLASCLTFFGENALWVSLIEGILSAFTCLFIAKTTFRIFGKTAAFIAGIISALYYELILWGSVTILTEPLYIFCLAAGIYFLVSGVTYENKVVLYFCLAGFFFGLTGLTRPLALLFAVTLAATLVAFFSFKEKKKVLYPLIFVAVCLLTMFPWGIRNYFALDHFTLLSTEGGHVFWLGNNAEYDKYEHRDFTKFGGYTTMFNNFPPEVAGKDEIEANREFYAAAWRHIFAHPADFIIRGFHKTWNMWRPTFSGSSMRNLIVSGTIYPTLLILSLAGMILALLRSKFSDAQKACIYALAAGFLFHLGIHFLITGEIRFRVPLWTILIPFAAFLIDRIYSKFSPAGKSSFS